MTKYAFKFGFQLYNSFLYSFICFKVMLVKVVFNQKGDNAGTSFKKLNVAFEVNLDLFHDTIVSFYGLDC
jgi:hypothetical protein